MNTQVTKTDRPLLPKKKIRPLNELKRDLNCLLFDDLYQTKGGTVFRIRRTKKLCGNIVPE